MAKLSLTDISSGYLSIAPYNANNTLLEAALENTLSRDGTTPNAMGANLDMNSYRISNITDGTNNQDAATVAQLSAASVVTSTVTQENIGAALYPRTSAEVTASVTPTNYYYEPGNVLRYFTNTTPGTTDATTGIQAAITVAGSSGGLAVVPEDVAINTASITFPTSGTVILDFQGHVCNVDVTGIALDIDGIGLGTGNPKHQIINANFQSSTAGAGTCIRIRDSQQQVIRNCEFHDFDKGVQLSINTTIGFCETTNLRNLLFEGNDFAIHITRTGGNYSFATTKFDQIVITTANATAAIAYGIYIDTDCDIYRSEFSQVAIFPYKTNSVAFYCDGKMRNAHGALHIEGNNGSATGNTGILLDTNASLIHVDIHSDIRGTVANDFTVTTTEAVSGWKTSSLSNINATIVKASKLAGIRAVVEEDLTTFNMIEKVTSAGVYQWQTLAATPPEFVDSSTGNLSPVRLLNVGNAEATAADGDLTPTVADTTRILLSQTTGIATISDFDDGVDGQVIVVRFIQSTHASTVAHNTNIVLSGAGNFAPANDHSTLTLMNYGGTVWREIGRMAT